MPRKTEIKPASLINCINSGSSARLSEASVLKSKLVLYWLRHSASARTAPLPAPCCQ